MNTAPHKKNKMTSRKHSNRKLLVHSVGNKRERLKTEVDTASQTSQGSWFQSLGAALKNRLSPVFL